MIDLSVRATEPEWMDDPAVEVAEFGRCLGDLASVNRVTLGHRPILKWLGHATKGLSAFTLLDIGFGQGDLLRSIARWSARRGLRATLTGIDLMPASEIAARQATPPDMHIDFRTADVFAYVPDTPPDFVVTSLMTHHLTDDQVVDLLRWIDRTAVRGWFNSDLHRHIIAYYGFRVMAAIARWHPMIAHDGAVSIRKSFRRAEWRAFLERAAVEADISWVIPFKLCVGKLRG